MENYRLTQTGEEVQEILNGAAMQTDLTAENERAEGAEQTLQGNIDEEERRAKAAEETLSGAIGDEELRAKAAEEALGDAIDGINAKIPAAASSENKLADQDFVNSSIETATATFRGTYNLVSDLHLAVDATHAQIATLLGTVITEADNNDYSYVLVPTSAQTPTEIASIEKYTFGANGWAFAYALNNSGFTSAQWAAINSGITSGLVAKLNALPTNTDLLALLAGKQDVLTFDDVPVEGSNNPVKSGGVHSAIDDEKTARVNAMNQLSGRVDTIEGEIPAQASSENQLADKAYVNSSISTATATYRGSFNLVADLGLSVSATHEQIGTALAGEISTADNNDYAYVQVPTSDETPSQILKVERYKFNGTAWAFEYELNNSGFTSAQWAAINSGITSGLVAKLMALPTNADLLLLLAGKQDVLTFDNTPTENSNNPVKSGGVYAADKALSDAIEAILLLIPSAATSLNKLVDTDLMNSSISTATATFRGTFNLVSDLSLDLTATHAQIATALAGEIATADNNDYAFVLVPTSVGTPTEIAQTDRYKFNGTSWAYEYTLNTSGFTSAQWAAINSGITAALVASLVDIPDLIPSEATSANQLADKAYVLAQILAATPAFKGQFTTLAELQAVASPKADDLGIVRTKDSDGMDVFTVYQYLNNAWNVFYSLSYHPQTKPATTGTTGDYPYNGMGRVELAKNMVNIGTELAPVMVNQLTQDMFNKGEVGSRTPNTNTIFVIRYDYVLAENITIPDGCVLEFEGGSISGAYTLTGQNTAIKAGLVKIFNSNVTLAGTWNTREYYAEWFGASSSNQDNSSSINNAIAQISNLGETVLVLSGSYVIEDTIWLRRNVSLRGITPASVYKTATPFDGAVGSGLIVKFSNKNKYAIDTYIQVEGSQVTIPYSQMYTRVEEIEGYIWSQNRKSSQSITDLNIQIAESDKNTSPFFGGIRLIDYYFGKIDNVNICGAAVGINLNNSWGCHISNCTIIACLCGIYFGHYNTTQLCTNVDVVPHFYGSTFSYDKSGLIWRDSSTLFPPYTTINSAAIISESYTTDANKVSLVSCTFEGFDAVFLSGGSSVSVFIFEGCYAEGITKTLLWTHSGNAFWKSPKYSGNMIRPYTFGTIGGYIEVDDSPLNANCYPASNPNAICYNILRNTTLGYDSYDIDSQDNHEVTNLVKSENKKYDLSDNRFFSGFYSGIVYDDSYISKVNTGLIKGKYATFPTIMSLFNPQKATFICGYYTDYSNGGDLLKDKDFVFIPMSTSIFPMLHPMKINGCNIEIGSGFIVVKTDARSFRIDSMTPTSINLECIFKCSGKNNVNLVQYTETAQITGAFELEGTEPIELNINIPWFSGSADAVIKNPSFTTKYVLNITTRWGTYVLQNTVRPINGLKAGDVFIENGNPIFWNGTAWVDATGTPV